MRVVDLFAGCGGTSEGARRAGLDVVWAANHWPAAVELHKRRHPRAIHVCQDLQQFDWRQLPAHEILWASPACQGHSEAAQPARARDKSIAAAHDHLRTTAWAVISAVLAKRPRAFAVENVPEFREWAPSPVIDLDGNVREFERGSMYRHWLMTFRLAGYHVTEQILTASKWSDPRWGDCPQRRRRLIIVGHLERELEILEPDVAADDEATLEPILDFDAGEWSPIGEISYPGARRRAEHADTTFGGGPCWGWHASHRGAWARSPAAPANTITTQNQHYLVRGGEYRLWSVPETSRVMGLPADYLDGVPRTAALVMAGNAVPPQLAAGVLTQIRDSL